MDLFLSTFETKIDSKDRVSIPARFRSLLERKNEDLILFTSPGDNFIQGCGNQYIERLWEANLNLDQFSKDALYIQDILSDSIQFKLDSEGRINLTSKLIQHAKLSNKVLFSGRGETFQIWEPNLFFKEKQNRINKMKGSKPQSLLLGNRNNK